MEWLPKDFCGLQATTRKCKSCRMTTVSRNLSQTANLGHQNTPPGHYSCVLLDALQTSLLRVGHEHKILSISIQTVLNFLDSPVDGILITDEVGWVDIEAGLIWTGLKLSLMPIAYWLFAILRDKWQSELENRFGIQAMIGKADDLLKMLQSPQECGRVSVLSLHDGLRAEDDDDEATAKDAAMHETKHIEQVCRRWTIWLRDHGWGALPKKPWDTNHCSHNCFVLLQQALFYCQQQPIEKRGSLQLTQRNWSRKLSQRKSIRQCFKSEWASHRLSRQLRARTLDQSTFIEESDVQSQSTVRNKSNAQTARRKPAIWWRLTNVENSVRPSYRIERINLLGSVINRTRSEMFTLMLS